MLCALIILVMVIMIGVLINNYHDWADICDETVYENVMIPFGWLVIEQVNVIVLTFATEQVLELVRVYYDGSVTGIVIVAYA